MSALRAFKRFFAITTLFMVVRIKTGTIAQPLITLTGSANVCRLVFVGKNFQFFTLILRSFSATSFVFLAAANFSQIHRSTISATGK